MAKVVRKNEQLVLGMILQSKSAAIEAMAHLTKIDFYDPKHQIIFGACSQLITKNTPIELDIVVTFLSNNKQLEAVGGVDYLLEIQSMVTSSSNIGAYIELLKNETAKRELLKASENIKNLISEPGDDISAIVAKVENEISNISKRTVAGTFRKISDVVEEVLGGISEIEKNGGILPGVKTGFKELDAITAGFQKSDYIILAARPSMGKTAFALNLLAGAEKNNDGAVVLFSLEMDAEAIARRLISAEGGIDQSLLKTPNKMGEQERKRMYLAADKVAKSNIIIEDTPGLKINELKARAKKICDEQKVSMIVIDYLSLITSNNKSENKVVEVGEISKQLKQLARELKLPIVVLSQLSRSNESRSDKRPMMSDIRESGAIEQDADLIMFLYRDKYYNQESEYGDIAELIIAKHRNGATGTIQLKFINKFGQFVD